MKKKVKKIQRTAIHEAAHAVMCFLQHVKFTYVSIIPNDDPLNPTLGTVTHPKGVYGKNFEPDVDDSPVIQSKIEKHIMVYFAGQIAEEKFFGELSKLEIDQSSGDRHAAIDLACYIAGGGKVLETYVNYLWACTESFFNNPNYRYMTKVLADELLLRKKIGSKKAREIMKKARNEFFEKRNDEAFNKKWKWISK